MSASSNKCHFQAFGAGGKIQVHQLRAKEHMHLADVRHVDQRIDAQVAHPGAGFLGGLANRRLLDGFAVLHEACGQGPVTEPWLDGASAQQHLRAPDRHATGDDIGVLVMNRVTAVADKTQARIAFWNALGHRVAALTAKFHAWVPECCAYLGVRRCLSASCRLATCRGSWGWAAGSIGA